MSTLQLHDPKTSIPVPYTVDRDGIDRMVFATLDQLTKTQAIYLGPYDNYLAGRVQSRFYHWRTKQHLHFTSRMHRIPGTFTSTLEVRLREDAA